MANIRGISAGKVLVITGTKLTDVGLKAHHLTNPTMSPTLVDLPTLGSVVSTDSTITVNITASGKVFYLSRADNGVIVYDFGE
ncbi:hypothetical protein EZS27_036705 [termite gut metagenome]|uniref:Uncharacterized protein n=1 Tax=termite gut metagenome TaxID=433724 RepID=A0A5J4PRX0_9ZZZZ